MAELRNLKDLARKKLELEKQGKTQTKEYFSNNKQIVDFVEGLSANDLKYFKSAAKVEAENKHNFLKSGMSGKVYEEASKDEDAYKECAKFVNNKMQGKEIISGEKYSSKMTFGQNKTQQTAQQF